MPGTGHFTKRSPREISLAFLYQLLVFAAIASGVLVLNVAQAWLREMIKLRSREWLTRDLFAEWLKPTAHSQLAGAGEIGVNPDQRIHEDARRLTELSTDLGVGLLQASLILLSFLGVLWTVSGALEFSIYGISLTIPGYMVWCALFYAASGSWLTWRVGRPLVSMNARRYQREFEFRFALFQVNQRLQSLARFRGEEPEKRNSVLVLRMSSQPCVKLLTPLPSSRGSPRDMVGFQLSPRSSLRRLHISTPSCPLAN